MPFPDGIAKVHCTWWPEGEARELCEGILAQALTPRALWMHRPHASEYSLHQSMYAGVLEEGHG